MTENLTSRTIDPKVSQEVKGPGDLWVNLRNRTSLKEGNEYL